MFAPVFTKSLLAPFVGNAAFNRLIAASRWVAALRFSATA